MAAVTPEATSKPVGRAGAVKDSGIRAKRPSIAVLIPTYAPDEAYLARCVASLQAQTLPKSCFRVYWLLNGPRDPYEGRLRALLRGSTLNSVIHYLPQSGVSAARNRLLDLAEEDYLAFVDDDDYISPTYLEALLAAASPYEMAVSAVREHVGPDSQPQENFMGRTFGHLRDRDTRLYRSRKYYSALWAKLLHRRMVGTTRFDEQVFKGEDALFMAQISPRIQAVRKASPTACYCVCPRPGSLSRSTLGSAEELRLMLRLLARYGKLLLAARYNRLFILTRMAATLKRFYSFRGG